jgi:methyl-accepting chemotaxis protein
MLHTRPYPSAGLVSLVLAQTVVVAVALISASTLALWQSVALALLSLVLGGMMLRVSNTSVELQVAQEPVLTAPATQPVDVLNETLGEHDAELRELAQAQRRIEEAEREAGSLRNVLANLDSGMRRLACSDFTARLHDEFPEEFEGLRMDFNRAVAQLEERLLSVTGSASSLHESRTELQTQAQLLKEGCASHTTAIAQVAASASTVIDGIDRRDRETGDLANIAHSAVLDLSRSEQAVAAPLDALRALPATTAEMAPIADCMIELSLQANMAVVRLKAAAADETSDADSLEAHVEDIRQLVEETAEAAKRMAVLGRHATQAATAGDKASTRIAGEMKAMRVYVEALHRKAQRLATPAAPHRKHAAELRGAIMVLARTSREHAKQVEIFAGMTGNLHRDLSTLDRETLRLMPVTTIQPNSVFKPQQLEERKRPSHLRLVKS